MSGEQILAAEILTKIVALLGAVCWSVHASLPVHPAAVPEKLDSAESQAATDYDGIQDLPNELLDNIFSQLHHTDIGSVRLVCRRWNGVGSDQNLWSQLNKKTRLMIASQRGCTSVVKAELAQLCNVAAAVDGAVALHLAASEVLSSECLGHS